MKRAILQCVGLTARCKGEVMVPIQNPTIEYPERMFEVELLVFSAHTHAAVKRTIKVLAKTVKGARRICKWRYRQSEIHIMRVAGECGKHPDPVLFPVNEF